MFEYYSPSTILSKILESSWMNFDENIWDAKHEVIMVQWHIGRIILDMLTMMEEVPPHFQATYFQPPLPTNAPYTRQNPSSKVNISTSTATDVAPTPIDTTQASSNGIAKESTNNNNRVTKIIQSQHNIASNIGGAFGKSISSGGQSPSVSEEIAKSEANSHVELTDYSTLFGPELKLPDDQWDASYLNVLDVAVIEEGILHVLFGCASQNAPQSLVRAHCALKYILLAIFAHVDDVLAKYKMLAPPPGQTFDGVEETKFPTSHPLENSETEKFH
ncbi:hypothetical protein ZIOFF_066205 [Zingiber officinale]|uniref:Uncharacterized protein n=1 Tax=Zingiber officinale TaxID=94328 RepID=A0A8J5K958_ZINOF|nr:hypothetical protein ZIOFF_066205 [Zingiber officinale]